MALSKNKRTLGVLGGMGPDATAQFYRRIMELFREQRGASHVEDFPQVLLHSVPMSASGHWRSGEPGPFIEVLKRHCGLLEHAGADLIALPCNSVHTFMDAMRSSVSIPILSIVDATLVRAQQRGFTRVGLLGTDCTATAGFFHQGAAARAIELIAPEPEDQRAVEAIIRRIHSGEPAEAIHDELGDQVERLWTRGAQAVALACTELPLVMPPTDVPLLDTLDLLAETAFTELVAT